MIFFVCLISIIFLAILLENFHIEEEDTPELFSSDHSEENQTKFSSPELNENNEEEDDLEIPAFLRRQKN